MDIVNLSKNINDLIKFVVIFFIKIESISKASLRVQTNSIKDPVSF